MAPFLSSHSEKGPPAPHQYWVYVFMYCAAVISSNVTAYLHNSSERSDQSAKQIHKMPRKESGTSDFRLVFFFIIIIMMIIKDESSSVVFI